jgi:predicted transposase YdaD
MHLYSVLLGERHGLEVRSVAVLLARQANLSVINGEYRRQFPGEEPYDVFRYQVVRVWELPVEPLLTGGVATLPLAPISAVTAAELPGVVERVKKRLTEPQAAGQADELWTAIYVLMGLRYDEALIGRLLEGVRDMEESVTYQAIIRKGEAKGRAEGRAEGQLEEARRVLLIVGRRRLGEPTADVIAALDAKTEVPELEQLAERLDQAASWQDLLGLK